MITIELSLLDDLRQIATFSIAVFYEMAASMHILTQTSPQQDLLKWADQAQHQLERAKMEREWHYFAPVFAETVPVLFAPSVMWRVEELDHLIEYLLHLPADEFAQSFLLALRHENRKHKELTYRIEMDLKRDPELVKHRLILFLSSYWQLVFEPAWKDITACLQPHLERLEESLNNHSLGSYLSSLSANITYDPASKRLSIRKQDKKQERLELRSLVLLPSWFSTETFDFSKQQKSIHVVYNAVGGTS